VNEDLDRAITLWRWLQERTSTRIELFRWGAALFNDGFPQRYFSNFVRVDWSLAGVEAAELAEETDRAMAGFGHRQIQVRGEGDGARLVEGLAAMGFEAEHNSTLALRRGPDRAQDVDLVDELPFSEVRPFLVEVYRRGLPHTEPAVVARFADFRNEVQQAAGIRFFARRVDGIVASLGELCTHNGAAQVEHLDTLEEFRGRGLAGSVVLRAAAEARTAGADLVCIDADLDGLAIGLYRRLGFVEIGRSWVFTRPPVAVTPEA
jgi:ribosomal protein S18 acetylase RimI-like enzyme